MPDKKISELDAITGSATAADDFFIVVDSSGASTNKISRAELNNAIEQDVLSSIEITDITNDVNVQGTVTAQLLDLGTNNPRIRFDDSDTSNNGEITLDNTALRIEADEDNAVANSKISFRVDGSEKAFINSSGLDVTGTVTADGLAVSASLASADLAYLNNTNATQSDVLRLNTAGVGVGTNILDVQSGDTTRFLVRGDGNVGIGTVSPAQLLHVNSTGNVAAAQIQGASHTAKVSTDGAGAIFGTTTNGYMLLTTNAAERMRITSGGSVGIGTSASSYPLEVHGSSGQIIYAQADSGDGYVRVDSSNAGSEAIFWARATTTGYSTLQFGDPDDSDVGWIKYQHSNNSMAFRTNAVEAMRIDSSRDLLVGYTSSNGAYKLQVNSQIFATSATIATSDGNYKENITPLDGALSLVSQLSPVQFDWKEHPVHEFDRNQPTIGFIAQEVQQVLAEQPYLNSIVKSNECVLEPEEMDDEGNVIKEAVTESFLGIAEGNMVALLTAAIKEQQAIITELEARITVLEAN